MDGRWGFMGGMGIAFAVFVMIFILVVIVTIASIIYKGASFRRERTALAAAPEVEARARVVDKRVESIGRGTTDVALLASPNLVQVSTGDDMLYQLHRITFEQAGGARFELSVPASQYGLIVEGDTGTVTMKGTELLAFQRETLR